MLNSCRYRFEIFKYLINSDYFSLQKYYISDDTTYFVKY